MEYILENEQIKLTVSAHGAEPVSVVMKKAAKSVSGRVINLSGAAMLPFSSPTQEN